MTRIYNVKIVRKFGHVKVETQTVFVTNRSCESSDEMNLTCESEKRLLTHGQMRQV